MHFGIYLTNHENQTIELPVAPASLKNALELDVGSSTVAKIGEVVRPGEAKLKELEFTVEIPRNLGSRSYITAQRRLGSGQAYLDWLKNWLESKKAGRILVTTTSINFPALLVMADSSLENGNNEDFIVTLKLKEWREYKANKMTQIVKLNPESPSDSKGAGGGYSGSGQGYLDNFNIESNKLRARGWHHGEGAYHYLFLMDAESNREISRQRVSTVLRPDVKQQLGGNSDRSGFDVFFDVPNGRNVYILSRRTNDPTGNTSGGSHDKSFSGQIVVLSNQVAKTGQHRAAPNQVIGMGSIVVVNGQLFQDSYGNGAGEMEHNAERKVDMISQNRPCPYHVTTLDGSWRGWVEEGAIQLK